MKLVKIKKVVLADFIALGKCMMILRLDNKVLALHSSSLNMREVVQLTKLSTQITQTNSLVRGYSRQPWY